MIDTTHFSDKLTLLMFKDYITILVGTLQRIHRQYIRYELALDDTLIGIENLNSGYLTHYILDPQILGKYLEAVENDLEETAPEFEPVFTSIYQYYCNSLISFTNTVSLCAKIGYMYYCEYAHLLKKRTEHTCMSAIYYVQGSDIKAKQCKTIVTFDTILESKILDASDLLILSNL